jgi:hypothetical protein
MQWIFDHFQIVFIAVIVIGSLAKQFLDAKAAERQAREEQNEGDIFDPGEDWGPQYPQTAPSVPPPLVRTVPPPLARTGTPPPLVVETEALLKRQQDMQDRLKQIKEARVFTEAPKLARPSSKRTKPATSAKSTLRGALRDRSEIRRAFVMREILGPPAGLK